MRSILRKKPRPIDFTGVPVVNVGRESQKPENKKPEPKKWPWEEPAPVRIDNKRRLSVTHDISPEKPGGKRLCPLCGRQVSTTTEHHTRYYGSAAGQPYDEWDTAIIYHCPVKELQDKGFTVYHDGQRKNLTDAEVAETYQRHSL